MVDKRQRQGSISRLLSDAVEGASTVVDGVLEQLPGGKQARVIKRYANRKLYDTANGAFTTLGALEDLVRAGVELRVVDHDSGDDLTSDVLGQIADRVSRSGRGSDSVLESYIRSPQEVERVLEDGEGTKGELAALRQQVGELTDLVNRLLAERDEPRRGKR